jgi:hypothetical protein
MGVFLFFNFFMCATSHFDWFITNNYLEHYIHRPGYWTLLGM